MLSCPTPPSPSRLIHVILVCDACDSRCDLNWLRNTVGLTRINRLAGLLDLFQYRLVRERVLGRDVGGLCFERDGVLLNACTKQKG